MRIISGKFKGRKFYPPADNWPTRPTTDYAKEGLFNILSNNFDFDELKVLDLFGGTGSHSYEFTSNKRRLPRRKKSHPSKQMRRAFTIRSKWMLIPQWSLSFRMVRH